ncbi:MAG: hypothetical protein JNN06_07855 [Gemmobacter sp.]|uniref:hypothetical protein n=1 Tax=Gemmobacter sp. TaxID=1898957 RepID=UPI001A60C461|nr:hypothetical protein [Gemmobacter sp.]MBL8562179.1 hypothetical protein [Gemmobacter sp.]
MILGGIGERLLKHGSAFFRQIHKVLRAVLTSHSMVLVRSFLARVIAKTPFPRTVLFLFCLVMLNLCGAQKTWTWHQKLSVTVITPDGPKTSSSVLWGHLHDHSDAWLPDARGASTSVRGEGVAIEVTPGRYLFVTQTELPSIFQVLFPGVSPLEAVKVMESPSEAKPVPPDLYPMMMTFGRLDDPASVRRVDPNNLEAEFGPGVKIQVIELSLTDEPITDGAMIKILPWLDEYRENAWHLNGTKCITCPVRSENLADLISADSFKTEVQ